MPPVFNAMARRRRTRDAKAGRLLRPVRFLLALVGAALMAALLVLNIRAKGFTSDLYSLAGDRGNLLGALSRKTTGQIRVLCDDEALADACRAVFPFRPAPDLDQLLAYYKTHARGLLCARTRERLEKGEFDKIRRSVTRRDYTGVGLFPKADDPDYFLSDYVAGLKDLMPKGLQGSQVLLTGEVEGHEAALPRLIALAEEYGGIRLSGAPFHAFLATEKSKREINLLGVLSCAAVLLLGLALFRSLRFVVPTVLTLAFGFLAGATAVFACFEKPHVLTFLFGTSLIGLGVDYCYHALWTGPGEALRRKLAAAFATTALAFSPLLVSSVAVLNQMAVFTLAGLAAILALVLTGSSAAQTPRAAAVSGLGAGLPVRVHLARLALFGLAAAGCCRLVFSNAPELFYAPPRLLADGEAKVAAIVGATGRFAITSGATLEEALANEEAAGLDGVSRLLPSLARQQRDEELIQSFSSRPRTGEYVTRENLPEALRVLADAMIVPLGDRTVLIAPLPPGHEGTAVAQLNPRAELTAMFETFNRETRLLLAVSFAVMALALLVLFRRRALAYAAPVFAAVVATAGVLGWLGEKITFFHALSFFVMTGLGIDYAIFHKASGSSDGGTRKVVLFSFLTSLVGFGALGLTSFPPTRAMGLTLALGLLFAYFFSLPRVRRTECAAPLAWHEQREQSAGKGRILIIWYIYRFLGKTAAKLVFVVPYLFIFPFCRAGREALYEFYGVLGLRHGFVRAFRQMLAFAWTMIDKTDACTLCKNPPAFTLSGDTAWTQGGAFLISSHLGCIEVLPALGAQQAARHANVPHVHAFQQMGHDAVFTSLFASRLRQGGVFTLHAVEDIGVETAVEMQDAIRRGELVLMAGDRLGAAADASRRASGLEHAFFGRPCLWPKGVFRFAKLMASPVYAIIAVKTRWNAYDIVARRLDPARLLEDYVTFLQEMTRRHPDQWYQFYRFFTPA